jgi:hypothetical protein
MVWKLVPAVLAFSILGAGTARAITLTLDDALPTVVRPDVGFVDIDFTGTISLTPGFELISSTISHLYKADGDSLNSPVLNVTFALTGVLFTMRVSSTDAPGLYNLRSDLLTPARVLFGECQIGGGACNNAASNYGVNVVAAPEPATTALVALGGGAVMLGGRRRRRV